MWDVLYAEVSIAAGDPLRAKQALEHALGSVAMRNEGFSTIRANLEIHLARADSEFGEHAAAIARIDRLMEQLRDADQAVNRFPA
ncbi:MAG TPA: hypothetical protein VF331_00615 [Polyangiales bacterium]